MLFKKNCTEKQLLFPCQLEGYREVAWADEAPGNAVGNAECDHPLPRIDLKAMLDTSLLAVRSANTYEGGSISLVNFS